MKIAKASERDMDMAIKLSSALESLERGFMPADAQDPDADDPEAFDSEEAEHCYRALNLVLRILSNGSIGRVVWGMSTVLDPRNKIVNEASDVLELHPDLLRARDDATGAT